MGNGSFEHFHPWEPRGPVKKPSGASGTRVRALYGKGFSGPEEAKRGGSLELVAGRGDFGGDDEGGSSGGRVSASDREKVYLFAAENLEKRKLADYSSIRWKEVMGRIHSELPSLKHVSLERVRTIYYDQRPRGENVGPKADNVGAKRGGVLSDPDIRKGLYEVSRKYVDPDSDVGRIRQGSWLKICKEMRGRFPALEGVGDKSIVALFHKDKYRRSE